MNLLLHSPGLFCTLLLYFFTQHCESSEELRSSREGSVLESSIIPEDNFRASAESSNTPDIAEDSIERPRTLEVGGEGKGKDEADLCAICLESLSENLGNGLLCGHRFHQACLGRLIKHSHNCPLCRQDLRGPDVAELQRIAEGEHRPQLPVRSHQNNLEAQMLREFTPRAPGVRTPSGLLRGGMFYPPVLPPVRLVQYGGTGTGGSVIRRYRYNNMIQRIAR